MSLTNTIKTLEAKRDFFYKKQFTKGLSNGEIKQLREKKNILNIFIDALVTKSTRQINKSTIKRRDMILFVQWMVENSYFEEITIPYEVVDLYIEYQEKKQ